MPDFPINSGFSLQWIALFGGVCYDEAIKTQEAVLMDKKKTGTLIREARIKKNYTQSELGDLIGVSNKAVSRWENGDSFPDIGVLENLSGILDVKIQDIVVGEISADDTGCGKENIITEVIRMAKLQEKSKRERIIYCLGGIVILLYSLFLALTGMNGRFVLESHVTQGVIYVASLAVILGALLWQACRGMNHKQYIDQGRSRKSRWMSGIAVAAYLYAVLVTGIIVAMAANGKLSPDKNKLQSVGTFLKLQLIAVSAVNAVLVTMEFARIIKEGIAAHYGIFVSVSAMYMAMLYGDMLHRMTTAHEVLLMYCVRTAAVILPIICILIYDMVHSRNPQHS